MEFRVTKHALDRYKERHNPRAQFRDVLAALRNATNERAVFNDTVFMNNKYEKYGYDKKYVFLAHEGVLFVGLDVGAHVTIVTCVVNTDNQTQVKKKFKKNKKQEQPPSYKKMGRFQAEHC